MPAKYTTAIMLYALCLVLAILCWIAGSGQSDGFFDFTGLSTFAGLVVGGLGTVTFVTYLLLDYTYAKGKGAFIGTILALLGLLVYAAWRWAQRIGKA